MLYIRENFIYYPLHKETRKWWEGGPKYDQRRAESVGEAWDSQELNMNLMEAEKYV